MNLVKVEFYAQGYYSGSTYESHMYIKEDTYNKFKDELESFSFCISELDGKHSETEVDVLFEEIPKEEQEKYVFELYYLDYIAEDNLQEELPNFYKQYKEEEQEVRDYIKSIDYFVKFSRMVKKSQIAKIEEFIRTLD